MKVVKEKDEEEKTYNGQETLLEKLLPKLKRASGFAINLFRQVFVFLLIDQVDYKCKH